jgi:uncharacterized protein (DUF427 family)
VLAQVHFRDGSSKALAPVAPRANSSALDLLQPSPLQTTCAYKGTTSDYWAAARDDGSVAEVAWSYSSPSLKCARIANLVCFFNEQVDGVEVPRPQTPWR